jgi:C4-dicarboxylate transporter DctM subunit
VEYEALIGLCCFLGMFFLILLGIPIFISMSLAAFVGFWLVDGLGFALTQFTSGPYNITSAYTFSVFPMFVLMGALAGESGIAESAYYAVSRWLARIRGGLLMATIGAAGLFGACSGVSMASSAIFTKISLPELDKYNYDKRVSMGCIAASGGLASLIPPSIPILIFCVLVNISIGKALIAGIIPGIMTAGALALGVWVIGIINPKRLPLVDIKVTWRERFSSLKLFWPVMFLFILVIGGIYAGIFPPTVGGAIGAAGVLVYALARGVSKKKILNAFWETAVLSGQLFPMLIGGFLFSRFISLSGLADTFVKLIASIQLPPLGVMGVLVLFYLFIGCVMELFTILIITLPIIFPIMTGLGFDPIALCIAIVFLGQIAGLTPPIGISCFVVASMAREDPIEVFRGILPFFLILLVMLWVVILFPITATWLPGLLF